MKIFDIVKEKTLIKGFWKDEAGKLHIDNIKIYHPLNVIDFDIKISLLFSQGQKAVFIEDNKQAFVMDTGGTVTKYSKKESLEVKRLSFNQIKKLLDENGGLTILKTENGFYLTYWKE